jgi:hypothetical protein
LSYPESGDHTRTWEYWQTLAEQVDTLLKGKFIEFAPNGGASITSGGVARPLPFATAAGYNGVWIDQQLYGSVAVTFPAGRFTAPPSVVGSPVSLGLITTVQNITTTGWTLTMIHRVDQIITGSYFSYWLAVQPTPAGFGAVQTAANAVAKTLTCHTDGCANEDIPIEVMVDPTVTRFGCGVCGQPITDVS